MKFIFYISCVAVLLSMSGICMASGVATVHGVAYEWSTFEPLDNAIIEVNTTPVQSMVAKSGVYSFDLSSGAYLIQAKYYQNGTLTHYGEEVITVSDEGSYVVDLLLLPSYTSTEIDPATTSQERTGLDIAGSSAEDGSGILIASSLALLLVLLILFYQVRYKKGASSAASHGKRIEAHNADPVVLVSAAFEPARPGLSPETLRESSMESFHVFPHETPVLTPLNTDSEPPTEPDISSGEYVAFDACPETVLDPEMRVSLALKDTERSSEPVPADLQEILDILISQGGRITQKDMRKRLRYSEGKVSLMLLDLEKRGKIQKFKKGRGNIIFLVEGEK